MKPKAFITIAKISYMFASVILQTINPTVSYSITELFLLPIQYVLKPKIQKDNDQSLRYPKKQHDHNFFAGKVIPN